MSPALMTTSQRRLAAAAPRPAQGFVSRRVEVAGLRLHVRSRAAATGRPWVLLHGLAVSHRYLMPTAAALEGGPVHVPDLVGFGLSVKPRPVLDVVGHSRVIAAWLDAEGIGPASVLANSFGCQVAVELAIRRPDLVAALVLVGPTVDPDAPTSAGQAGRWLLDLTREDPRQAALIAADVRDAGIRRVLTTLRLSVRHRIEQRLPLVTQPVLVLRGEHDPIVPPRWARDAGLLAPRGATGEIPGAAHNAVTTAGTEVAARALAFVGGPARPV
ncbi:alpha/beta fold hydrolase [Actinoplanes friuliensis]|jgi:pimeloyl-ACP methyl ester carboxylesterase|uniref:Putative alpha/beta hydrolase fold protein n=1 Tax=Actinoplanes friuliensis DSM 7358 TaxID=1246995 RepID=U5W2Y6_9ACTN|nr:alpha/beta hydrolase [Actinoplanes friuliensis]AGZ42355.1 putative alpha/beta hydrolase fold protein [Actinoplanes friuliensis DSM 7358]